MNVLFFTQAVTLRVYYQLLQILKVEKSIDKVGFYISDSSFYKLFIKEEPNIESGEYTLTKEWELAARAERREVDLRKLEEYQEKLKVRSFWDALVSDRRIILGSKFTFRQDYEPQFSHDQILQILLETLETVEKLFDAVRPDFTSSFICTTVGEYVCYLFSRARSIPFLNLRPTRIANYMMYGSSVYEPSELVERAYDMYGAIGRNDEWIGKAQEYVTFSRKKHAMYEGVFLPTQKPPQVGRPLKVLKWLSVRAACARLISIAKEEAAYRRGPKYDRHVPGRIIPLLYWNFLNPLLIKKINRYLAKRYILPSELGQTDYVFFPLHKEPEVTLLVYSRHYLNQIEVIRNVAFNLPVGKVLVVKEHPASMGTRPLKYYKKILDIPNVRLVAPRVEARKCIQEADLTVSIAGSVGFEALLLKKPVLTFGATPYEVLPSSMIRKVENLNLLGQTMADLIANHRHDETALLHYIAATMKESVPIEFYTKLLGRADQYATERDGDLEKHLHRLAEYTLKTADKIKKLISSQSSSVEIIENSTNARNGSSARVVLQQEPE